MNRLLAIPLIAMVCQLWPVAPVSAQTLQWKFSEGDSFAIRIEQSSQVVTRVDRREVDQQSKTELDIDWVVDSIDEQGNARIIETITGIRAELNMPGEGIRPILYDSAVEKHSGDARRLEDNFAKLVNQPFTIVMTPQGEIVAVEIPEETMEQIRKMPASMQGRKMLTRESLAETFAHSGTNLPQGDVSAGDTWTATRDFSIGTPQSFEQTTNYTLGEAQGDSYPVTFVSELAIADPDRQRDPESEVQFEALEIEQQESSGQMVFDAVAGHCRESSVQTKIHTKSMYRDMEVRAQITSQIKMTISRE